MIPSSYKQRESQQNVIVIEVSAEFRRGKSRIKARGGIKQLA